MLIGLGVAGAVEGRRGLAIGATANPGGAITFGDWTAGPAWSVVQASRIRPDYSAFGQTIWSLTDQERFLAKAACDSRNASVLDMMTHIEASQRWGLGTIGGSAFKGGWGPSIAGEYLVRQFGIVTTPTGTFAVALAAEPVTGSFDDGIAALTAIAQWVSSNLQHWPVGTC